MTTKIPTDPDELKAALADREKVEAMIADGTFPKFVQAYARATNEHDKSIMDAVQDQTEATLAQFLKDNKADTKGKALNLDPYDGPGKNGYHKGYNPKAVGAKLDGKFEDISSFLQATWVKGNPDDDTAALLREVKNYQTSVGEEGGFLVPEEFRAELLRLSLESSVVRPRARVIPMANATLRFPMIDSTSNASSVFGGIQVFRTQEGDDITASEAKFGSIKLEATKQTALARVTNELVQEWGAFGMFIAEVFPEAIAFYEDADFLSGSGAGEPLGALAAANGAIVEVAKRGGQAADTIVWENIIDMYARMLPSSLPRSVWIASQDTFVELATMALTVGTGGSAVWLTDGRSTPVLTLLGRPVILTEKAPGSLGDKGDLSFVDFGMYLVGDRQRMVVDSSIHESFTSDKTTYRIIQRNDGRPWLQSAITPKNGGDTLSPFVQLAARD
jgi:HK97 family phage major capsid protein